MWEDAAAHTHTLLTNLLAHVFHLDVIRLVRFSEIARDVLTRLSTQTATVTIISDFDTVGQ